MRSASGRLGLREKVVIALLMSWIAGFIDLVGYLALYKIYTAHMSGNTVAMARHLADMKWSGIARDGWPIATFVFASCWAHSSSMRRNAAA